jgi:NitT/TauT family transport system permease protein
MTRPLNPDNKILERNGWSWQDGLLILAIIALIFAIVKTAAQFSGDYSDPAIATDPQVLPQYTAQTLLRMTFAYFLSLGFSIVYAYIAYRSSLLAKILIPLLDILQSIPVLSFLPGVVLVLISWFPGQTTGVEIAAILLIFSGMTWNLVFSFYQSLSNIPRELIEAAHIYRLSDWQRFWTLELPAGTIGLIWNSVMSVAGGWFFLIAIESFTLGDRSFRLPGLGSFLAKAADTGDWVAIGWGLSVTITIIVALDFFVWQPLIAWAEKFKFQTIEAENAPQSIVLDWLRQSPTLRLLTEKIWQPFWQQSDRQVSQFMHPSSTNISRKRRSNFVKTLNWLFVSGFAFIVLWGTWEAVLLLQTLSFSDWQKVLLGAIYTALRVTIALILSLLWTIPVGVAIGRQPRLAKILQPLVQIAASIPATAFFPVLLLALSRLGGGLQIGSVLLMMLGTMWYILFNVIAGAQAIPEELFEVAKVYKLPLIQQWQTVILPGIFPYLVTGMITAVGGAWNASIVSEYVQFQGQIVTTSGLGEIISQATATGNFSLLLAATGVMSILVVLTNRLVWRRLYLLAQEKYQLDY